ncbi:MAG: U32 family peptidase [Bacteroidia bacterium]|nr:U32 family peptidase [Bacteroidia bacterium]
MLKKSDIEIMSPVGSFESLAAAIQGGADSVYFGAGHLNMRSKSSINFSTDDLKEIVVICKEKNIKTYLTVNTIIYDDEFPLMRQIVDAAKKDNITAIIASDQGVINYAHSIGCEIHISTQLNIGNIEALRFYSKFADVIVLARELTLRQVAAITKQIDEEQIKGPSGKLIRIEIFAHGALCMAVSGKCYLSLHENNYSANRGACLQPCRKAYIVTERESGNEIAVDHEYIMSPKDLCTIGFIDKILNAGVKILKIEGRARSPEYVKTVTQCYREAVNSYFDGSYSMEKITAWEEKLTTIFNRGFWDGYYLGRRLGEWSGKYGSVATKRKIYIGKGLNYFSKLKVAEFLMEAGNLKVGDEILITGPTTGVIEQKVNEIRVNMINVEQTQQGDTFSMPVSETVRRSDKLYKIADAEEAQI